jgi:hypothetical protein
VSDPGAVDRDPQPPGGPGGERDRQLELLGLRDIRRGERGPLAKARHQRGAALGVEIGDHDVRAVRVQRARRGFAKPRGAADDQRA